MRTFLVVSILFFISTARALSDPVDDCRFAYGEKAISLCTLALNDTRLPPGKRAWIFALRGTAHVKVEDHDKAIADFTQAIRLAPKYDLAYEMRGHAYHSKRDYDGAVSDFSAVVRIKPSADAFNGLGLALRERGDLDRALSAFDKAIEMSNPDAKSSATLYTNRGTAWRLKGNLDRALADQSRALDLAWGNKQALRDRADTYRYMGEYDRALVDYLRADRNDPRTLVGLGLIDEKRGYLSSARKMFTEAVQAPPNSGVDYLSAIDTAKARLAALDAGIPQPTILIPPSKVAVANAIPTPAVAPPPQITHGGSQERRVALVIGNSAYKNAPLLRNPARDAMAVAASLRSIGFQRVTVVNDATKETITRTLRSFAREAENSDWALVYYAGHGIEVGGKNYLIPIDARLAFDRDVETEAIPVSEVLGASNAAKKLKLVLLDACRDNPFTPHKTAALQATPAYSSKIGSAPRSRSVGKGLTEIRVESGTLVVFAARDGQVALDGESGNSPFAVAVVQRIATPGVEINKIFRLVRDDVMEATAGRQEPYTYGSLPGKEDFFFVTK